jgi:hypothetical protein
MGEEELEGSQTNLKMVSSKNIFVSKGGAASNKQKKTANKSNLK